MIAPLLALALVAGRVAAPDAPAVQRPPLRPAQLDLYRSPAKELAVLGVTQALGKTYAGAAWTLMRACGPDAGRLGWWGAPTMKQTEPAFDHIVEWARNARILSSKRQDDPRRVELRNGSRIDFVSWEREETILSASVSHLVIDQAEGLTATARANFSSRRSATLGPVRFLGNANIVGSEFFNVCAQAQDPNNQPRMAFLKWTWRDALASMPPDRQSDYQAFIDSERGTLHPSLFKSLYEAEWASPEEALFDEETIQKLFCLDASDVPHAGHPYVIGWDVGLTTDYTVGVPLCMECLTATTIIRERGGDPMRFKRVIAETCKRWNNAVGVVETNNAGIILLPEARSLYGNLSGFLTDNESKREAVFQMLALARQGKLKFARIPEWMNEFRVYQSLRSPTSLVWSFAAPPGMHDDIVTAAFIAVSSATRGPAAFLAAMRELGNKPKSGGTAGA